MLQQACGGWLSHGAITPYAAVQAQNFHTPTYSDQQLGATTWL
jgi:hypothetical protein